MKTIIRNTTIVSIRTSKGYYIIGVTNDYFWDYAAIAYKPKNIREFIVVSDAIEFVKNIQRLPTVAITVLVEYFGDVEAVTQITAV